jgi:UDP-glucose 4-epimerase
MTFNLGTGKGHSLLNVLSAVEKVAGKPVKREMMPKNPAEPQTLVADPAKAMNLLNWKPLHSDLETIVSTAYAWHAKENK